MKIYIGTSSKTKDLCHPPQTDAFQMQILNLEVQKAIIALKLELQPKRYTQDTCLQAGYRRYCSSHAQNSPNAVSANIKPKLILKATLSLMALRTLMFLKDLCKRSTGMKL